MTLISELETSPGTVGVKKRSFNIPLMIRRIREAVRPFAKAALFELAEDGFTSPFEQLVACIISIRTRDEVTTPTARRLFARARTPLRKVWGGLEKSRKVGKWKRIHAVLDFSRLF